MNAATTITVVDPRVSIYRPGDVIHYHGMLREFSGSDVVMSVRATTVTVRPDRWYWHLLGRLRYCVTLSLRWRL